MAVVGKADIIVRAITTGVKRDIERGFNGLGGVGARSGKDLGNSLTRAFRSAVGQKTNGLTRLRDEIKSLYPEADAASRNFTRLMRVGYVLQGAIGAIGGSVGALVGGLFSLVGAAGGAVSSLSVLLPIMTSFGLAVIAAKLALGGVGAALSEASKQSAGAKQNTDAIEDAQRNLARTIEGSNERIVKANKRLEKAQLNLNKAFEEAREEIQQLNFDSEDAALSEKRAALELERARETLLRVQDLPPNSRARREAELAYAEADLSYRRAIDTNSDLAAEQARLAASGVEGTETVISAREELANAEEDLATTIRDAARDQEDAQRALERALRETGAAGASAYNKLFESQQRFVDYLLSLKPLIDDLKESIADVLLPKLETAIRNIVEGAFPTFKKGLVEVASALGDAAITFSTAFQDRKNLELLGTVFTNAATSIRKFGDFAKSAFGVLLALLVGIDPTAQRFLDWVIKSTEKFESFLKSVKGEEAMAYFFQSSGDQAARFGTIFGNIFGGIKDLIYDSFKPGSGADVLLTYFEKVTEAWKNTDPLKLNNNLRASAENSVKMFDALGDVFGVLMQIGRMKEVGQFWDNLASASSEFAYLMREAVKVAPAMGELVASFTKIAAVFQDSGQAVAFFETLQFIAGGFVSITESLKPFFDAIGPAIGIVSALGLTFAVLGTSFTVLVGFGARLVGMLGAILPGMAANTAAAGAQAAANTGVATTANAAGLAMKAAFLTNPITIAILAIVTAATGLWALFSGIKQERMDKAVSNITSELKGAARGTEVWNKALLALPDNYYKEQLGGVKGLKDGLKSLNTEVDKVSYGYMGLEMDNQQLLITQNSTKDALAAVGEAFADLAVNDIAAAQDGFQKFAESNNLSNAEMLTALDQMPKFKEELAAQAEQFGVNVYNTDGLVSSQELLNFAMETGQLEALRLADAAEEEAKRHNAAMQQKMDKLADAALSNSGYFDSLKDEYEDGEFDLQTYLDSSNERLVNAQKLVAAKLKLVTRGATDEMLEMVDSLGDNALTAAEDMLTLTDAEFAKIVETSKAAGFLGGEEFSKALASQEKLISDVAATLGQEQADKLIEQLSSATTMDEFKRVAGEWQKSLAINPTAKLTVSADTSAADRAITALANRQIRITMPDGTTSTIGLTQYMKQYAQGGLVTGPGSGTSDSIMARLSNGEFVVNAASTSKFLPLLQEINGGKYARRQGRYASGGLVESNSKASSMGAPTINMTINPSPGMDERTLAAQISRQLALQLRKGAIA